MQQKSGNWTKPYQLLAVKDKTCCIQLPSRPTSFKNIFIKPYFWPENTCNIKLDEWGVLIKLNKLEVLVKPNKPEVPVKLDKLKAPIKLDKLKVPTKPNKLKVLLPTLKVPQKPAKPAIKHG